MNIKCGAYTFKDEHPIRTIAKVREFLSSKNILVQEYWNQIGNHVYSVHLSIPGTTITSNGKGVSVDLALASAYGELVERLSFLLPFRVSTFYSKFYEVILDAGSSNSTVFRRNDFFHWMKTQDAEQYFSQLSHLMPLNKLMEFWETRISDAPEYCVASIFKEFCLVDGPTNTSPTQLIIPLSIVDYYYGSNGMCAGNTKEEALVQGISEIVERHVQTQIILSGKVHCYDITQSYLSSVTEISETVDQLAKSQYSLTLLLCVSEIDIPVVAAILRNSNGEYGISFGCHPYIHIGVERAVTELVQGYNLQTLGEALTEQYLIDDSDVHAAENYSNLLETGQGAYPIEFILGKYPRKQIDSETTPMSNKRLLEDLCTKIHHAGYKIYLSAGLKMGLHCYHVVIPGLSEVQDIFPPTKIRNSNTVNTYGRLEELKLSEAERLAELCAVKYMSGSKSLEQIVSIDKYMAYTDSTSSIHGISSSLFISLLYMKAKKWSYAINYIDKFCNEIKGNEHLSAEEVAFYNKVRYILEMVAAGWSRERICHVFDYEEDTCDLVHMILAGKNLFDDIPDLTPNGLLVASPSLKYAVETETNLLRVLLNT